MPDDHNPPDNRNTVHVSGDRILQSGDTGNYLFAGFVVASALTPFLQSFASHFGSRLAGAIDEATRAALRRYLRREIRALAEDEDVDRNRIVIKLQSEHGWSVVLYEEIPAEAMGQLVALHAAHVPDWVSNASQSPYILWDHGRWLLVGNCPEGHALHRWNIESETWTAVP
ncbi:hypothetical protein [Streptomyces sp. NPDC029004]|uniref:hypothetical protein n=1 Tax=Streptomyces sp. NPDC029004 TaxID=3154490 RepID=UPI0033EFDEBE